MIKLALIFENLSVLFTVVILDRRSKKNCRDTSKPANLWKERSPAQNKITFHLSELASEWEESTGSINENIIARTYSSYTVFRTAQTIGGWIELNGHAVLTK